MIVPSLKQRTEKSSRRRYIASAFAFDSQKWQVQNKTVHFIEGFGSQKIVPAQATTANKHKFCRDSILFVKYGLASAYRLHSKLRSQCVFEVCRDERFQ